MNQHRDRTVRFTYVLYDAHARRAYAAFDMTRDEVREANYRLQGKTRCMWLLVDVLDLRPVEHHSGRPRRH